MREENARWPASRAVSRPSVALGRAKRLLRGPLFDLAIIFIFIVMALFPGMLAPYDPVEQNLAARLAPPVWQSGGSPTHLLGTDHLGRDILSRIIFGARISLIVAVFALIVGGGLGTVLGVVAGFLGGKVDIILMRFADATLSFPVVLLAILLAVTMGSGLISVAVAASVVLWVRVARVVRGDVLSVKARDFVTAASVIGASKVHIMRTHILPNILNTVIVMAGFQIGWIILLEAILSFLGAGIPPPTPAWGYMTADGRNYITTAWWISTFPGLAIFLVVLALNRLGDWLRDSLDPRLQNL